MDLASPKEKVMSEEENVSVEDQTSQAVAEAPEDSNQQEDQSKAAKPARDAELNFAELRRSKEELARKLDEQDRLLKKLMDKQEPEDEEELVSKKEMRKILNQALKGYEESLVDDRISMRYPDFKEVVSSENVERLKQEDPELAQALAAMPDRFTQASAAYKMIKRLAPQANYSQDKEKAVKNAAKPVSVNSATKQQGALGDLHKFENGLSASDKKRFEEERLMYAKMSR